MAMNCIVAMSECENNKQQLPESTPQPSYVRKYAWNISPFWEYSPQVLAVAPFGLLFLPCFFYHCVQFIVAYKAERLGNTVTQQLIMASSDPGEETTSFILDTVL